MQNDNLTDESSDSDNSDSDDEEGLSQFSDLIFTFINILNIPVLNGRYKNINQLEWDNTTM